MSQIFVVELLSYNEHVGHFLTLFIVYIKKAKNSKKYLKFRCQPHQTKLSSHRNALGQCDFVHCLGYPALQSKKVFLVQQLRLTSDSREGTTRMNCGKDFGIVKIILFCAIALAFSFSLNVRFYTIKRYILITWLFLRFENRQSYLSITQPLVYIQQH